MSMIDTKIAKPIKNFSGSGCTSVPKFGEPSSTPVSSHIKKATRVTGAYGKNFSTAYVNMGVRPDRKTVDDYTRKVR